MDPKPEPPKFVWSRRYTVAVIIGIIVMVVTLAVGIYYDVIDNPMAFMRNTAIPAQAAPAKPTPAASSAATPAINPGPTSWNRASSSTS